MISQRTQGLHHLLLLCQAVLAGIAMLAGMGLAFGFITGVGAEQLSRYPAYWIIVVFGLIFESVNRGDQKIASDLSDRGFLRQHSVSVRQTLFAAGALLLYLAVAKDMFISRTVLLIYLPVLYGVLFVSNYTLPLFLAGWLFSGTRADRALLIGPAERASHLEEWLREKALFGFRALGVLNEEGAEPLGLPCLGRFKDWSAS